MEIPSNRKRASLLFKAIVVLSAAAGVFLSARGAANTFMGGKRVLMFFTIQSNIAIALIALIGTILLIKDAKIGTAWATVRLVGTVSITLTGAVFTFMLAPTLGDYAWNVQNVLTHVVVPVAAILDFFLTGPCFEIPKKNVFYVILPPGAYALYAGIGYLAGWEFIEGIRYPYFFLNWGSPAGAFGFARELPYLGCVWWILLLMALLIAVGLGYLALAGRIRRRLKSSAL